MKKGTLYLVSTPIGNLSDITFRAIETLKLCDYLAVEDTRVTQKLLNYYNISNKKLLSYANHNLKTATENMIQLLNQGNCIALTSDAGTPLISDPGELLVVRCRQESIPITHIPGCSSVISALILSGISSKSFSFWGFIPNKISDKKNFFSQIHKIPSTLIFFETKNHLLKTLHELLNHFPSVTKLAIARELTKLHEEVIAGTIEEVILKVSQKDKLLGEMVIILDNNQYKESIDIELIKQEIQSMITSKNTTKDIVANMALKYQISKNFIYDLTLKIKSNDH